MIGALDGAGSEHDVEPEHVAPKHVAPEHVALEHVLPLVVRIERADPPARTDALEAAARAVLVILADGRPEWSGALAAWQDARVRKLVRRARATGWRRACALPGLTVRSGTATVRVYPPVPLDGWPGELSRLQVSGTELADPAPPPAPGPRVPVLWLNPQAQMSAGKAMAQAGHAAQLGWCSLSEEARSAWCAGGFALAVRTAEPAAWDGLVQADVPVVRDAGFTEVAPGSATALADVRTLNDVPTNRAPRSGSVPLLTRINRREARPT